MKTYYVYILKCADGTYYTGITNNLERRIHEHKQGIHPDSYTSSRLPVQLVFYAMYTDVKNAIAFEKKIKKWSRAKKEALIDGRYADLVVLAKKIFYKKKS